MITIRTSLITMTKKFSNMPHKGTRHLVAVLAQVVIQTKNLSCYQSTSSREEAAHL